MIRSLGKIRESYPIYASSEEAVEATRNYVARNIEAIYTLSVTILDSDKEIISEVKNIKTTDIVAEIKSSKQKIVQRG